MKIVTWNINGIRSTDKPLKTVLDELDAEIICIQETKVTRDQLDEPVALVEGYSSYFSFSRTRSGYSGVATYCKQHVTPNRAEEGLTGVFGKALIDNIAGYGDNSEFTDSELQSLDAEGRAVLTQHSFRLCGLDIPTKEEELVIINVYCPRADPEKEDRLIYKLRFYQLLKIRAEALLSSGRHVIILGDLNTSHKPIDHCDPGNVEKFVSTPSRIWLNDLLSTNEDGEAEKYTFVDTFRYFQPDKPNDFTCWCSKTSARQTNYGTRIDYIIADATLVESFSETKHLPEVHGSDHCPVIADINIKFIEAVKHPSLCSKFLPEFAGKQQKLSDFFRKSEKIPCLLSEKLSVMGNSQAKLKSPDKNMASDPIKRHASSPVLNNHQPAKKPKIAEKSKDSYGGQQVNLFTLFKKKHVPQQLEQNKAAKKSSAALLCKITESAEPVQQSKESSLVENVKQPSSHHGNKQKDLEEIESQTDSSPLRENNDNVNVSSVMEAIIHSVLDAPKKGVSTETSIRRFLPESDPLFLNESLTNNALSKVNEIEESSTTISDEVVPHPEKSQPTDGCKSKNLAAWKGIFKGPPQPPVCKGHSEPCVLRTVKKDNLNKGRQFWVCSRPEGHSNNIEARCNHFEWVTKKSKNR